jgi:WD40 repeat protein
MFCLSTPSITNHSEYKNWTPLSGRIKCFSKLRDFLEIIYPVNREEIKIQPGTFNKMIKNAVIFNINSINKNPTAILNLSILDSTFFSDTHGNKSQINFEDDIEKKSKRAKDDEDENLRKSNNNALKVIRNEKISQSLQVNKISEIEDEEAQMFAKQRDEEQLNEQLMIQNQHHKDQYELNKKTISKNKETSSNSSNSNNYNINSGVYNSSTPIKKAFNTENSYTNTYTANNNTNNQNSNNTERFNTSSNNFNNTSKNNQNPSVSLTSNKKGQNNIAKSKNQIITNEIYPAQEDEIEEEIQNDTKLKKSKEINNNKYFKYQNELLVSTNSVKNNLSDLDKEEYYMKSQYEYYDYDITSLLERKVLQDSHPIRTSCFSPKGDFFALGTNSKSVKIFDMKNLNLANMNMKKHSANYKSYEEDVKLIFEQKNHHLGSIYCLDWSISGRLLATGSNDKLVKLMVIPDLEESYAKEQEILELTISGHRGTIRTVTFDPTSDLVLLSGGTVDHTVKVWDAEKGTNISNLEGHSGDVNTIRWSNDSIICASSGMDKTIRFWDLREYKSTSLISALKYADVNDISIFTRNKYSSSTLIAAGHADGTVTIWDYQKKYVIKEIFEHTQEVR